MKRLLAWLLRLFGRKPKRIAWTYVSHRYVGHVGGAYEYEATFTAPGQPERKATWRWHNLYANDKLGAIFERKAREL